MKFRNELVLTAGIIIVAFLIFWAGISSYYFFGSDREWLIKVNSFEECVDAGYDIIIGYPRKCSTPEGYVFIEEMDGIKIDIVERLSPVPRMEWFLDRLDSSYFFIEDEDEWADVFSGESGVDFDKYSVIVFFGGEKSSGGHLVEILDVLELEDYVKLIVKEISPGTGCMVTEALTYPFDAVVVSKISKTRLDVDVKKEVYDC